MMLLLECKGCRRGVDDDNDGNKKERKKSFGSKKIAQKKKKEKKIKNFLFLPTELIFNQDSSAIPVRRTEKKIKLN